VVSQSDAPLEPHELPAEADSSGDDEANTADSDQVTALVVPRPPPHVSEALQQAVSRAKGYAQEQVAKASSRAYAWDWRCFEKWCGRRGVPTMPPSAVVVAAYLGDCAFFGSPWATVCRRLAGISYTYRQRGTLLDRGDGSIQRVLAGIRRRHGVHQGSTTPLLCEEIAELARVANLKGQAILFTGWFGALRRSEIVDLNVENLVFDKEKVILRFFKSKMNQVGHEELVAILRQKHTCPVATLERYLPWREQIIKRSGLDRAKQGNPLFFVQHANGACVRMPPDDVTHVIRACAEKAWKGDPKRDPKAYSGHSLRRGFITQCKKDGLADSMIMKHTRHKSLTSFMRYIGVEAVNSDGNPTKGMFK
jgi:integrase